MLVVSMVSKKNACFHKSKVEQEERLLLYELIITRSFIELNADIEQRTEGGDIL